MTNTVNLNVSTLRARTIYDRLMALPRDKDLSNNEWTRRAKVNTSFFTNLKNGSEPSVGNLRAILTVVGVSLPEFFVNEAEGRLVKTPTAEQLEAAIGAVLPGLPRNPDKRAQYLAEAVQSVLELPVGTPSNVVQVDLRGMVEERRAQQLRESNKSSGSALPRTG